MEVKSVVAYQGPNLHAHFPVIRYTVDLGILEEWPTARLGRDFIDRLVGYLPGLQQHGCSYHPPGGFVRRMCEGEGTWLGHVMEHVAIELQKVAGSDVSFGKTRATGPCGHYGIVYEYHDEDVGRRAGDLSLALWTHLIPATLQGLALHNVQNAMFAAALAHGLGIDLESIRNGLCTFNNTFLQSPGRLNICDEHPFRVILDYAHNPAAVKTICGLVDRLGAERAKIVSLTVPGDRRDEDILEIGRIAAGHFEHYICHRDSDSRGRDHLEVPEMLREALRENGVGAEQIDVIADEQAANQSALDMAQPGDLLLLLSEDYTRAWEQIMHFRPNGQRGRAIERRAVPVKIRLDDLDGFEWDSSSMEIIRDERGVRLAREIED